MGGRTGWTWMGKLSEAAAAMRLDLPVARSPTTTTRMLVREEEAEEPGIETNPVCDRSGVQRCEETFESGVS